MRCQSNLQAEATLELTKITLRYNPEEDRLDLSGQDAQGKTIRLWLTLRLLLRLIPHFLQRQAISQSSCSERSDYNDIDASSSGSSAEMEVHCGPETSEVLVKAVDLRAERDHLILTFKDNLAQKRAAIILSADALGELNLGLKRCFKEAEWPHAIFIHTLDVTYDVNSEAVTMH